MDADPYARLWDTMAREIARVLPPGDVVLTVAPTTTPDEAEQAAVIYTYVSQSLDTFLQSGAADAYLTYLSTFADGPCETGDG
jgi:hypothetical protein